jgi:plastocyanin
VRRWLAALVGAVALVASGCGDDDPPVVLEGRTNEHGTETAGDALEVGAYDAYFEPTYIKASADRQFAIELRNEGGARHTFPSPGLGVDLELEAGSRRTLTVKAPSSGHALFFCRFHQLHGMQGAVFVG